MKKRFSSILRTMALCGMVASGLAKALILLTASPVPDPASSRTEPSMFAPAISANWSYITPVQAWLLIVIVGTTLACVVAWRITVWLERRAEAVVRPAVRSATATRQGRHIFGRRHR
ncbi:hypothetical protein [Mesorhizobium sp. ES1-1]|uniref:hypothetical protein n=1 Tax=Mesorhizobium sp. ES1-1 TaxID=2876629 RepID=UPI001CCAD161|nr:hypothetical protein [Mesorhizobium sp. ES1-1]MBZ9678411.1 hypothetical protein [Mesorhizobium sp. ES1-1]